MVTPYMTLFNEKYKDLSPVDFILSEDTYLFKRSQDVQLLN